MGLTEQGSLDGRGGEDGVHYKDFLLLFLIYFADITDVHHHTQFIQFWELNTGLFVCLFLPTDMHGTN